MCPGCIGSALLLLSGTGAGAAGGLAAIKLRLLNRSRRTSGKAASTPGSQQAQNVRASAQRVP
jgi:hypothetical protein